MEAVLPTLGHNDDTAMSSLRAVVNQYQAVLDRLPAGVVVLNSQGVLEQHNPIAEKLLGTPLLGENWCDIVTRELVPSKSNNNEIQLRCGRIVSLATQSLSQVPGQLILLNDITEHSQLKSKINHIERLSSMGEMSAQLAHQIRTPLASALLYAKNLSVPDLKRDKQKKFISKIIDSLNHIEMQVKDMLAFARGNTVRFEMITTYDLMTFLKKALSTEEHSRANLEFINRFDSGAVTINKDALLGALQNCINNSVESTKEKISITITLTRTDKSYMELTVSDNGPGIKQEIISDVIEPFFTTRSKGTGLGLAVAKLVAENHGGKLKIESILGTGTNVCFCLPLSKERNDG